MITNDSHVHLYLTVKEFLQRANADYDRSKRVKLGRWSEITCKERRVMVGKISIVFIVHNHQIRKTQNTYPFYILAEIHERLEREGGGYGK